MMFRHAALAPWARRCRQALGALLTVTLAGLASAQAEHAADSAAHATTLPATVRAALAAAQLPPEALAVLVLPAEAPEQAPRLAWQIHQPMNPASVMKLVTTLAALDLLGPAYTWQTPVYLDGTLQGGVLRGNVYVQGQGDPQLVAERLWLLLQRLQAQGVQAIEGDIVLDRSAFQLGAHDPAAFDGEPLRPYNAAPDALLINYQTLTLSFVPDVAAGVARIAWLPPLAQWSAPESVPLAEPGTPCGEWQQALQPQWPEDLLTGYGAAVTEAGRLTDQRIELTESEKEALNERLLLLREQLAEQPEVTITYFQPDEKKTGGAYVSATGPVKKIDEYERAVLLCGGEKVPIDDIAEIDGGVFGVREL